MKNLVLSPITNGINAGKVFVAGNNNGYFGGIAFRSLPSNTDKRGTFRMKWYRTLPELKCDMRYRTGGSVKAEIVGTEIKLFITFDLTKKEVDGGIKYYVAKDAEYVQLEDFAATQDFAFKGDVQTKYSFEKEDNTFEEAITHDNKPIIANMTTRERGVTDADKIIPNGWMRLFRSVSIIDPKEDEVYECKIYTERAKQKFMSYTNPDATNNIPHNMGKEGNLKNELELELELENVDNPILIPDDGANIPF